MGGEEMRWKGRGGHGMVKEGRGWEGQEVREGKFGFVSSPFSTNLDRMVLVSGRREQYFSLQRDTPLSFIIFP